MEKIILLISKGNRKYSLGFNKSTVEKIKNQISIEIKEEREKIPDITHEFDYDLLSEDEYLYESSEELEDS